jgi:peptidyl-prolyl cis-trans isomerase SurA
MRAMATTSPPWSTRNWSPPAKWSAASNAPRPKPRAGVRLPPESRTARQALDALIDERAMITTARESGMRVDDARSTARCRTSPSRTRSRMEVCCASAWSPKGIDYARFRANLRDQIMIERLREREVYQRIRISDEEIDKSAGRAAHGGQCGRADQHRADPGHRARTRRPRHRGRAASQAEAALARVRSGEAFEAVAREVSEDGNRGPGG